MAALKSDHIAQHMSSSKRCPDILATYTSTLRESFKGHKDAAFEDWVQISSDDTSAGPSTSTGKLRWPDVHQIWEVTNTQLVDAAASEYNNPEIEKAVLASKSQDRSASSQRRISRKRRSKEEPSRKCKKFRTESEPEPKTFLQQITDEKSNLTPKLRCAYYALERLSSASYITHGTAVELEGKYAFRIRCESVKLTIITQTLTYACAGTMPKGVLRVKPSISWTKCRYLLSCS